MAKFTKYHKQAFNADKPFDTRMLNVLDKNGDWIKQNWGSHFGHQWDIRRTSGAKFRPYYSVLEPMVIWSAPYFFPRGLKELDVALLARVGNASFDVYGEGGAWAEYGVEVAVHVDFGNTPAGQIYIQPKETNGGDWQMNRWQVPVDSGLPDASGGEGIWSTISLEILSHTPAARNVNWEDELKNPVGQADPNWVIKWATLNSSTWDYFVKTEPRSGGGNLFTLSPPNDAPELGSNETCALALLKPYQLQGENPDVYYRWVVNSVHNIELARTDAGWREADVYPATARPLGLWIDRGFGDSISISGRAAKVVTGYIQPISIQIREIFHD